MPCEQLKRFQRLEYKVDWTTSALGARNDGILCHLKLKKSITRRRCQQLIYAVTRGGAAMNAPIIIQSGVAFTTMGKHPM
jgi:hypothetical protein